MANSWANLIYNLVGYLPAPFIYGLVIHFTGGNKSRWGLVALQASGLLTGLCLVLAFVFKKANDNHFHDKQLAQVGGMLVGDREDQAQLFQKKLPQFLSLNSDGTESQYLALANNSRVSLKTPASERLKLESMSALFSKSFYPISLGIAGDEDEL